jgi:mannose-6-phosphate isomerase-like protein (cupin superfamily)
MEARTMRLVCIVTALLTLLLPAAAVAQSGAKPTAATELTNDEIQEVIKKLPKDKTVDQLLELVDVGRGNFGVAIVTRAATPAGMGALSHDKITEIYYVLRGSGTQVTGGTMTAGKPITSAVVGPSVSGTTIENGRSSKLAAGDVQVIPPGVPHMWSSIDPGGVEYIVFRVDPERVLSIK